MAQKDSGQGPTVFWSWQSDYDENSCRYFVRDALNEAIKLTADAMKLEPAARPSLDHDTKGAKGMVDIKSIILSKIERCSLFVADLTPIGKTEAGKWIPNPNVMIELGWAMHAPGVEHVIPILNLAPGCEVEDLPFDIRGRRVIRYSLAPKSTSVERKAELAKLVPQLRKAIEEELKPRSSGPASIAELPVIEGVEASKVDQSIWRSESGLIKHFEFEASITAAFYEGPRAYVRVIPDKPKGRIPSLAAFEALPLKDSIRPNSNGCSSGSWGATENGYIQYWFAAHTRREIINASMYFEDTGEIWSFNAGAFDTAQKPRWLDLRILKEFNRLVLAAIQVQDQLGWPSARRVEVGFVSDEAPYIHLPNKSKKFGRKASWKFEATETVWSQEAVSRFMTEMLESFFSVFGVQPPTEAEQIQLLS